VTLAAKVIACLPHAVGVLLAMSVIGAVTGGVGLGAATWLRLVLALILGALPFALLGLAVGLLASPNATTAILMAYYLPSAVASGLWMPLDMLPEVFQRVAPALPTYHLAQLALAQLDGRVGFGHGVALMGFGVLAAAGAMFAYRRARP
jgi:ABC-2 type transport system permease protein